VASSDYIHGLQEECAQLREAIHDAVDALSRSACQDVTRPIQERLREALPRPEDERG
jgi:hypothetical protein